MILILSVLFVLCILCGALFLTAHLILRRFFGVRCEGNPNVTYFQAEDFPGLQAKSVSFPSNRGQLLRGFIYSMDFPSYKGLIIFVHGMGGGHTAYMTEIHALAQEGYLVLGYDNTGTMLSDGAELGGFPQAFLDLRHAISFLRNSPLYRSYPLFLVGHSWGAYTVCNFPHLHENIQGVIALSAFDNMSSLLVRLIQNQTGKRLSFLKPFFLLSIFIDYRGLALYRPSYSLQEADCPVLILHGDHDPTVPLEESPLAHQEVLNQNSYIQTQICPGKGHNVYASVRAEQYMAQVFGSYEKLEKEYDQQLPPEIRLEYFEKVDFRRMTEEDPDVMSLISNFLNQCLPEAEEKIR
ncbi:MAG TPA: alpha/beta fold hydrolase [Candidatus Faecimorpha stercoravium]|nr:alpha/beta fold hydrolase [Candidatus Faecimorpha stercoravium]